jgi:hypothetical protein
MASKFATIRAIVMIAGVCWCSYYCFRIATQRGGSLRWYNRTIYFLGAILMAGFAIGGILLVTGKLNAK